MTRQEKVEIIIEELDKFIQVDFNLIYIYRKAIAKALIEIERNEDN